MLSKWRLGPKLLLAPAVVLVLLVALSGMSYYGLVQQNQSLENIVQQRAARMKAAAELVVSANRAHTQIYQLLSWVNASFSQARLDTLTQEIHKRHLDIERQYARLQVDTAAGGAERNFVEQSRAAHQAYELAIDDVVDISLNDRSIATNAMLKAELAFDVVAMRLGELSALEQQLSERAYAEAQAQFRMLSTALPLVVALSVALSLLVTMAVRDALLRDLGAIGASALDLGQGNLTVQSREYGKDEIGDTSRALDASIRHLNTTLSTILASAQSIDTASREIAEGNAALTSRSEAQAATIEQTASSMRALTATMSANADNAQLANRLASYAADFAVRGGGVVQRLGLTMASIRSSTRKVVDIVGVIDSIASQTNMLAMDAAAEAQRAGEHGHGLARVAVEVSSLAQRSASAAGEIKQLIASSAREIEGGALSAGEAGLSLAEIVASVHQVGALIGLIGQSSSAQADGMSQVNLAILQMNQMSEKNTAMVEAAAARAEGLQDQALGLSQAVAAIRLEGDAGMPAGGYRRDTPAFDAFLQQAPDAEGQAKKNAGSGQVARLRLASRRDDTAPRDS